MVIERHEACTFRYSDTLATIIVVCERSDPVVMASGPDDHGHGRHNVTER
jgi:hypothetical protein